MLAPSSDQTSAQPAETSGRSPWISRLVNVGLCAFLVYECVGGVKAAEETYDIVWWVLVTLILLVNVLRRGPAFEVDTRWFVWLVCMASSLHFLAFEGDDARWWADILLVGIFLVGDLSLIYLGRSFSILPARRTIRRGFAYRLVRHPAYATYICADVVFVVLVPTPRNFVVLCVSVALWMFRAVLEEALLRKDPVYREYASETPWRLVPLVW